MDANNINEYLQYLSNDTLPDKEYIVTALKIKYVLNSLELTELEKNECYELVINKLITFRPLLAPKLVAAFKIKYWAVISAEQFRDLGDTAHVYYEAAKAEELVQTKGEIIWKHQNGSVENL